MHSVNRFLFITIVGTILIPFQSRAQFQVNVMGIRYIATPKAISVSDGAWGAGASLRYFVSPRIAVGLNARYYANRYMYSYSLGLGPSFSTTQISNLVATGQVDYFFPTKSALQPYAGLEAGMINARYNAEYGVGYTTNRTSSTKSYFLAGPKAGLQCAITPTVGISLDASYQFIIDRGYIGEAVFINAGGFLKFGRR